MTEHVSIAHRRAQSFRRKDLSALGPILQGRMQELQARLAESLHEEVEEYAQFSRELLYDQAGFQLRHVYAELTREPVPECEGPEEYGRRRADQGFSLEPVMRVYRVVWTELWDGLKEACALDGGPSDDWLLDASTAFLWMADRFEQRMLAAYRERSHELLVRSESTRGAILEGLFSGYLHGDDDIWRAASVLDLPYTGCFIMVAAATPGAGSEALPGIRDELRAKGLQSVWRLGPELEVGVVSLRKPEAKDVVAQLIARHSLVRVGMSPIYASLAKTPKAMHMARLVLATIPEGSVGLKQFSESAIAALLADAPNTAQELRETVLGPLLALPESDAAALLETLSAWFRAGGDITKAAAALHVHPNTVRYRLRKIQAVTHRTLDDPRDVSLLQAALLAADLVPPI